MSANFLDHIKCVEDGRIAGRTDVDKFFADPALRDGVEAHNSIDAGHGRIEQRAAWAADAEWLAERHPQWRGLRLRDSMSVKCSRRSPANRPS